MITPKICYYILGIRPLLGAALIFLVVIFNKKIAALFNNTFFRLSVVAIPPILIFTRILLNDPFFLSDDFAHLNFVYNNSYIEILKIILSKPGIWVNHHIVLGFWLFKLIYNVFGTNIYPYVFAVFLLNLISSIVFYVLSGEFLKNIYIRVGVSFIFGLLYLSWISNIHELTGAIFLMLSFYAFVKWIKSESKKSVFGIWSIVLYIAAIFSKEITFLIFPFMYLIFWRMKRQSIGKKELKILIPFFLIFIAYSAYYASTFAGYFGSNTGYGMGFDVSEIVMNLSYYLATIAPGAKAYLVSVMLIFAGLYFVAAISKNYRPLIFLAGFFLFIFPPLLFTNRISTYYAYIPAIFLLLSLAELTQFMYSKLVKSKIKPLMKKTTIGIFTVLVVLGLFSADRKLMDEYFLIFAPWPNPVRQQFLSLIADIKKFEAGNEKSGSFILSEKSKELVSDNGVAVIKPFLDKRLVEKFSYEYKNNRGTISLIRK